MTQKIRKQDIMDSLSEGILMVLTDRLDQYLCKGCQKGNCNPDCHSLEAYDDLTWKMSEEVIEFVKKRSKILYMLHNLSDQNDNV